MNQVTVALNDDMLRRLEDEAQRLHLPVDAVISAAIEQYFEDEPDNAAILDGLRQAMQDVLNGNHRPVDEVLAELKEEFDFDANES